MLLKSFKAQNDALIMIYIVKVVAREILDSRGNPTIEVDFFAKNGTMARASVPSGASTGVHEAVELRDGGKRFLGQGVLRAVKHVNNTISLKIVNKKWRSQEEFDSFLISLDGTATKKKFGANTLLVCSLAFARLSALERGVPLFQYISNISSRDGSAATSRGSSAVETSMPRPFFNVLNGGKHADSDLAVQEFMIAPKMKTFAENLRVGSEVYHILKKVIHAKYGPGSTNVGDEGGFACSGIRTVREALDVLVVAIGLAGYTDKVDIALDCAASEFYDSKIKKYVIDGKKVSAAALGEVYVELVSQYPIISIEDPFHQEDFSNFAVLLRKVSGTGVQVVGDDLTVTNVKRISIALENESISCLLLKVNQIGTVWEAVNSASLMFDYLGPFGEGQVMVSHRSGETEDTFISHLAVGLSCGMIKSGAPCRGERVAKYNELLRIEEGMNDFKRKKI